MVAMDNACDILSRIDGSDEYDVGVDRTAVVLVTASRGRTSVSGDDNDGPLDVDRKNNKTSDLFRRAVQLRDRVSLADHMHRLYFLLTWSDRNGGRWMGIKRFIDCYFSLVFHPYFGDRFKMTVLHIAKRSKICCHFQVGVVSDFSSYTLLIMLNYPLWDKLLQVSTSLPHRYFRRSVRAMLRRGGGTTDRPAPHYNEGSGFGGLGEGMEVDPTGKFTHLMNVSLAALCLIDRLEYSMQSDLERHGATHVVTVAKFFSNAHDAKNLFNTVSLVE